MNKTNFIKLYMYVTFGFMTEIIFTAIGGHLVGVLDFTYLSLIGKISLWMAPVYVLAFPLLNKFNDSKWACSKPMWLQTLIGGFIIGLIEFSFGFIFNVLLGFNCWDYSHKFMNILGQVCLQNYILFTLAYPMAIWLIDKTEWVIDRTREELNYGITKNYMKLFTLK